MTASAELLRALISQNELTIMRLKGSRQPYAPAVIKTLQRDIDRWRAEIAARNSIERMR
jgi:hypothetical protein